MHYHINGQNDCVIFDIRFAAEQRQGAAQSNLGEADYDDLSSRQDGLQYSQ